ncbi:MAG TPA: phytanoyl-CoA dioxygenase family protein [Chthonomonadaceae bacterium]|nr:phytanoyl-CoA dioxygenase family protein [Chthonomonadaceae bacterium]
MENAAYLAGHIAPDDQIAAWVEQFHRDGYLFLESVLPPDWIAELKADLDRELRAYNEEGDGIIQLHHRMFETSPANLRLFDLEPIVSFAEALIATTTHVIHNNSFRTPLGKGITTWHQDDSPHYLVLDGDPPGNVRLPVLLFTANYYLTDVPSPDYGPTQVIPGSHLFGASPPTNMEGTRWERDIVSCCGPAGSVVMFNNQVWHRGGPNLSDRIRYMAQVSYARRLVGHKYAPFMNYTMPERCYADASPRLKRLLGFLPSGAYG